MIAVDATDVTVDAVVVAMVAEDAVVDAEDAEDAEDVAAVAVVVAVDAEDAQEVFFFFCIEFFEYCSKFHADLFLLMYEIHSKDHWHLYVCSCCSRGCAKRFHCCV